MIYAISYKTESCDEGVIMMESQKPPTDDQVNTLLFSWLEDEYFYGVEDAVSWYLFPTSDCEPEPNKDQVKAFKDHCKKMHKENGCE